MALQVTGKVELFKTGVDIKQAYLRIETTNKADGTQEAKVVAFASKQHYKSSKEPLIIQSQMKIFLDFGFKFNKVEASDLLTAHNLIKEQFESNGFTVEIVDI